MTLHEPQATSAWLDIQSSPQVYESQVGSQNDKWPKLKFGIDQVSWHDDMCSLQLLCQTCMDHRFCAIPDLEWHVSPESFAKRGRNEKRKSKNATTCRSPYTARSSVLLPHILSREWTVGRWRGEILGMLCHESWRFLSRCPAGVPCRARLTNLCLFRLEPHVATNILKAVHLSFAAHRAEGGWCGFLVWCSWSGVSFRAVLTTPAGRKRLNLTAETRRHKKIKKHEVAPPGTNYEQNCRPYNNFCQMWSKILSVTYISCTFLGFENSVPAQRAMFPHKITPAASGIASPCS